MFRKTELYLVLVIVSIAIIFFIALIFSGRGTELQESFSSPSPVPVFSPGFPSSIFTPLEIEPILTEEIPLKPETEGGGVDLDSTIVQQSQSEIAKILPLLPYQNGFIANSGKNISILIPGAEFQTTPWVLDVQIFGINYQVSETDPDYNLQKDIFIAAASNIFEWMQNQGVGPEKMIINWGDKSFIRESAEKWLSQ